MSFSLFQFGICLQRLKGEDVELVRYWRNHPTIRQRMNYQEEISQEQQKKWFNSINNKFNYYFLIIAQGKKIGLINAKNASFDPYLAEGGIFLWDEEALKTALPVMASISLIEFFFISIEAGEQSFVKIRRDNQQAIDYNKKLGYYLLADRLEVATQTYLLRKEDFLKRLPRLKRACQIISGNNAPLKVQGLDSELNAPIINRYLNRVDR